MSLGEIRSEYWAAFRANNSSDDCDGCREWTPHPAARRRARQEGDDGKKVWFWALPNAYLDENPEWKGELAEWFNGEAPEDTECSDPPSAPPSPSPATTSPGERSAVKEFQAKEASILGKIPSDDEEPMFKAKETATSERITKRRRRKPRRLEQH